MSEEDDHGQLHLREPQNPIASEAQESGEESLSSSPSEVDSANIDNDTVLQPYNELSDEEDENDSDWTPEHGDTKSDDEGLLFES